MTDDEEMSRERICCCQPCHDLLVKLGLLELNTGMLASLLSFESWGHTTPDWRCSADD